MYRRPGECISSAYSAAVRASVIIPALNAASTLGDTLHAVTRQELAEPYEVIVVDDGSSDATLEIAVRALGEAAVLRQCRLGAAAARNRGAEAAGGAVLAFTDADCIPERKWLAAGLAATRDADVVQGEVWPTDPASMGPLDRSLWIAHETGLYETANLFVRREWFDRLGGFESWLEPRVGGRPLAEDVWFGWRARRAGARTSFSPNARVTHAVFRRGLREYVSERRRLRHFPAIAAKMPELRRQRFFGRYFLTSRSAAFDAALTGAATAVLLRSRGPLIAATPYAWIVLRHSVGWRRQAPVALLGGLIADIVGLGSMVRGSIEQRTLLI